MNPTDTDLRILIARLVADQNFAVEVTNLMKTPDKHVTVADWKNVAMSLPRLYAVIEAAELAVRLGHAPNLFEALVQISDDATSKTFEIACVTARLAWQAQQPLLGQDRLARPVMAMTSGNLPSEELVKDRVRVQATAKLILYYIPSVVPAS